jgi:hypothetical protein
MKVVIFGLAVSSSWGNGHATLWRGLCRTLAARGHLVVFFERDAPYYAAHRDLTELPGGELILYADWPDILPAAGKHLAGADVGMVTSYCPDGLAATDLLLSAPVRLRASTTSTRRSSWSGCATRSRWATSARAGCAISTWC